VRETPLSPDPALDLIVGLDFTWLSAFIVTPNDERIAIVGRYDVENIQRMDGFNEIFSYDENIFPDLMAVLAHLDPEFIALNYSENDAAADGLAHGLWLLLNNALSQTPYKHRFVSAEKLLGSLRGRKTTSEIARVRRAVAVTEEIIDEVTQFLAPGQNAVEIHEFVKRQMAARGVEPAWNPCPMVTPGPDAPVGHALPDEQYQTAAGQLLHMDLGVVRDGYVSDLQRVWYLKHPDEDGIPAPILHAFEMVRGAILAAASVLKPGVAGWKVDEASRGFFLDNRLPEYKHAVGHHIGRSVHDGATVLGPRWERYGNTPEGIVEVGNIFTLELGISVPGYGFIGLEEDVLVKENGLEWLSTPQEELIVVG
jgi:Xaa-Pro aminopeptidase